MNTLRGGLTLHVPSEVDFRAIVTGAPHFFYGTHTHAIHEAFTARAAGGTNLEIVDNVALAPRIPVIPGDRIRVRGELIPDAARGPLVHWTHRDPRGVHADGFIELRGRRYA